MDYGLFTMPSHPPERGLFDGHQWDLQQLRWADELGFSEAWIGEHHTAPWEPHPAPDLLVAQALLQTKRMRIGPGGFLMPYHHPAELANRVAMLDHLAQGRLNFGVAARNHRTDSVDYLTVISGEIDMELDDSSVHLRAGDVMVQRGTIHNWVNRGTAPCVLAVILIDAKSVEAGGKVLAAQG